MCDHSKSWFSEEIEYEGTGSLRYRDPAGTFTGPAKAVIGADGRVKLTIAEPNCDIGDMQNPGWWFFFNATKLVSEDGKVSWGGGGGTPNVCEQASMSAETGQLNVLRHGVGADVDCVNDFPVDFELKSITVSPNHCIFQTNSAEVPKYWVVPLINFLGIDFQLPRRESGLEDHPLRLHSSRGLCAFRYKGKPAFIEPVVEYTERSKALENGDIRSALTAVMVGEVVDEPDFSLGDSTPEPASLLTALDLVDGTEVGAPWIEYRDASGNLVGRWHARLRPPEWRRKQDIILEPNLSHYLECAAKRIPAMDGYFHFSMTALLRSFSSMSFIDNSLSLVCASLDSLCNREGLSEEDLIAVLSDELRKEINDVVLGCSRSISSRSKKVRSEGDVEEAGILEAISSNVANARYKSGKFGRRVERLLSHYGFEDLELLAKTFEERYGKPWWDRVSYFRSIGVHGRLFNDWDSEYKEMWAIVRHLQDIVTRVLLRILEYDGEYSPITFTARGAEKVDWVKQGIPPSSLGYDFDGLP